MRMAVPELGPMLWHSYGTVSALLQEILYVYPLVNPPLLTVSTTVIEVTLFYLYIMYIDTVKHILVISHCE